MGSGHARKPGKVLLETLFPGRCLSCGSWLLLDSDLAVPLCDGCRGRLRPLEDPRCRKCGIGLISETGTCLRCRAAEYQFDSNVSLFPYTGVAKCLLASLKFGGRRRVAPFFAALLADRLSSHRLDQCVLVPVPPRRRRTPDAVELVARALEKRHGLRVLRLLERAGTMQQKSLDYDQRKRNLVGKIRVVETAWPGGFPSEVVLLDDVFTTGATLDACARAVRDAGCQSVRACTLVMEE